MPETTEPEGGDPVCWLERVCDTCGALEDGPPSATCARCGTPRDQGGRSGGASVTGVPGRRG